MSFNQLPSLEAQPTTFRRSDDPEYRDDPEYDRFAEELSVKLFSLTSKISRLSTEISHLGTKRETERVRERVQDLLEDLRDGFREVGEGVKKLSTWENLNPSQRYTQQKLSREFQASGSEFQVTQRIALEKQRSSASAARTALESQDISNLPQSSDGSSQQQVQLQEQDLRLASQDEVDFQDSLIVERESEIRNIEQSVGELNELFKDVAHMVHEQGGQLDMIDANVVGVAGDTRQADVELRSASKYQKSARGKACCLLLILAAVLTIIILAAALG